MPTPDGDRLQVSELNTGHETTQDQGILVRISRNISLFLAGMYTGVRCSGTPNRYHSYDREQDDSSL